MFKFINNNFVKVIAATLVYANVGMAAPAAEATAQAAPANDQKIEQEFDGLGGNGVLLEKARALNPEVHTTVVQNRMVDRTFRFELSGSYDNSFGGDTYIRTGTFGVNGRFHFSNRWALGAKYGTSYNKLTSEGEDLTDRATAAHLANPAAAQSPVPDIDYPKAMTLGFIEFYPLYGKISWLGKGISHFDVYAQLGYGNVNLDSGTTNATEGALGVGIWGTEHLTTRLEISYMDYTAQYYNGPMELGVTSASIQVGWLF